MLAVAQGGAPPPRPLRGFYGETKGCKYGVYIHLKQIDKCCKIQNYKSMYTYIYIYIYIYIYRLPPLPPTLGPEKWMLGCLDARMPSFVAFLCTREHQSEDAGMPGCSDACQMAEIALLEL